jgi:endogenous inhibitor of DNA gyrase (YacG/DUF329 family)
MTSSTTRKVACPNCKQPAEFSPANLFRPFCSERCKLIDLGVWASEGYAIPDTAPTDELDDVDGHKSN